MLFASTFFDALLKADFVTALRCPLGTIGLLIIFLGFMALIFFAKESVKAKFLVFFFIAVGVSLLGAEISKPTSGLTAPPAYTLSPPPPPPAN